MTGTGQQFISQLIGADILEPEIVCQYTSAIRIFKNIKTIIDIGGQDSKLILIDELDGIAGRKDYGGVPALVKVIKESAWPIIITANNPFDNKFSSIRSKSELLQFKILGISDVL